MEEPKSKEDQAYKWYVSKFRLRVMGISLPAFIAIWPIIYFTVVLRCIDHLPTPLTVADENTHPGQFIAERAKQDLLDITKLGPRVVGSPVNEIETVNLLLDKLKEIQAQSNPNLYKFEYEVQNITGSYVLRKMYNIYASERNVVVKITPTKTNTTSSLLLNSHFDSRPRSPGAGDDGAMVVVMLEILRVLTRSHEALKHSLVFLFNGAEENPLQGSHGFITQHRWAPDCKAFLNMDAAGTRGKEALFQTGPNHPWLVQHYGESAPHPLGTSLGEELFQTGLIPSDTDFRIFRDFGSLQGLDMALYDNGYNYHTSFDAYDMVPEGTLQNIGDNVLAISRSIASGIELEDPTPYAKEHVVFYDFLGWFLISYKESFGTLLNYGVSLIGVIAIAASVWGMVLRNGLGVFIHFGVITVIQIASILLGFIVVFAVGFFMDYLGLSLVWYGNQWLIFGIYICPGFLGLTFIPSLYLECTRISFVSLNFKSQLFTHANCLVTILLTVIGTALSIRTSYIFMLSTLFHIISIILDFLTVCPFKKMLWMLWVLISQILPFMYFSYLGTFSLRTLIPMHGRIGSTINPEIIIAPLTFFFTWLSIGFLIPVLYSFRMTRGVNGVASAIVLITFLICLTPVAFPFKEKYAPERISIVHSRRVVHDAKQNVLLDQPIYYISPQERRAPQTLHEVINASPNLVLHKVEDECKGTGLCHFPFTSYRTFNSKIDSYYINAQANPFFPDELPKLALKKKTVKGKTVRLTFRCTGPNHIRILFAPTKNSKIIKSTFNSTISELDPPYLIYYSYGEGSPPLDFFIELKVKNPKKKVLEVSVSGYWTFQQDLQTQEFNNFLDLFPKYTEIESMFASYENSFY